MSEVMTRGPARSHAPAPPASQTRVWIFVHGTWRFRMAATLEFVVQMVWLWAADRLRNPGSSTGQLKRIVYLGTIGLWLLTFVGPMDGKSKALAWEHAVMFAGYFARFLVFVYVAMHACHRCTSTVHCCCGDPQDWQSLGSTACSPGKGRLRYVLYYILTKPGLMMLVNLPLGYPLAFLATFASAVRCLYALLLAFLLRPAPTEAMVPHFVSQQTEGTFRADLATRLLDFAYEAYGEDRPIAPAALVSFCSHDELNGRYEFQKMDANGFPIYGADLPTASDSSSSLPFLSGPSYQPRRALLRRTPLDEWEVAPDEGPSQAPSKPPLSPSPTSSSSSSASASKTQRTRFSPEDLEVGAAALPTEGGGGGSAAGAGVGGGPMQRWAFVKDETAKTPFDLKADAAWMEFDSGTPQPVANPQLEVHAIWDGLARRRFEQHGECRETDSRWVFVEEDGPLVAGTRTGEDPEEVSMIIAFRGTDSWSNVRTDGRISLQLLSQEIPPMAGKEGREPFRLGTQLAPAVAAKAGHLMPGQQHPDSIHPARPSLTMALPHRPAGSPARGAASSSSSTTTTTTTANPTARGGGGSGARTPPMWARRASESSLASPGLWTERPRDTSRNLREPLATADAGGTETGDGDRCRCGMGWLMWILLFPCRLLRWLCLWICFPCQAPSDHEDDDLEFSQETLDAVKVHSGFLTFYASVRFEVLSLLSERLQLCRKEQRRVQVYLAGHSLGGAVANLCALDIVSIAAGGVEEVIDPLMDHDEAGRGKEASHGEERLGDDLRFSGISPIVYTFGAPRIGNAAFRSIYNGLVPKSFRVVAARDAVSSLPPSISYRQMGREVWFDDCGHATFVMSWAMRQILPNRDNIAYHPCLWYYRLLKKNCELVGLSNFPSTFRMDPKVAAFVETRIVG